MTVIKENMAKVILTLKLNLWDNSVTTSQEKLMDASKTETNYQLKRKGQRKQQSYSRLDHWHRTTLSTTLTVTILPCRKRWTNAIVPKMFSSTLHRKSTTPLIRLQRTISSIQKMNSRTTWIDRNSHQTCLKKATALQTQYPMFPLALIWLYSSTTN